MKLWTAIKAVWCAAFGHDYGEVQEYHTKKGAAFFLPEGVTSQKCKRCGQIEWSMPAPTEYHLLDFDCLVEHENFLAEDEKPKPPPNIRRKEGDTKGGPDED